MAKQTAAKKIQRFSTSKRTSIGRDHRPLNKHKRNGWKKYRGQGRPG